MEIESLPVSEVTEGHLRNLVDNQVAESQTLEFKGAAVGPSNSDKQEFLKDVTALANTSGGLLLYGIVETDSTANDVVALNLTSIDHEILRLQNILSSSVEPQLSGVQIREIKLAAGGHVLIVRVP